MSDRSSLTIFLIDDCAVDRYIYRQYLQHDKFQSYNIVEFETAKQAMTWCEQQTPDVILLDYLMPDEDGREFLRKLRENLNNQQSAIILLTGAGDEMIAVNAMKNGAQDYLVKNNFTPKALHSTIHHAVERLHLTRQLEQIREQQQLITTIALRIRQSLKLEEILSTTAIEMRQFLKADRVLVYQFQPDMSGVIVAESVLPGWTIALGQQIEDTCFQQGAGSDYRQGKKRAINNIYQAGLSNCHLHLLEQFEVKAYLVVPILVKEQLWGLLIAQQCSAFRHWESVELDLLDQLGVQIAIAIQQASAYQQVQTELAERQRAEASLKSSEERLKLTLNFTGIGYWEWNPTTKQISASQNAIHGCCAESSDVQLTLEQWFSQLHPEDRLWVEQELKQAIATQTDYAVEYRVVWSDNSIHWVSAKGRGIYNTTGQLLRMLGVLIDITERKFSEAEHQQSEILRMELNLLEQVLEVSLAGYWDWDIPSNQEYLSPTFKQMCGYADHELPNTPEAWQRLIFPEDLANSQEMFGQHVQSRGQIPYYGEVRYRHKDGSTVWVICSGRVIAWDEDGNPLRMIGCHIDITERKQIEAQLIAINRLQQAILDGSDYAIIYNNSNGIQIFNAAAQKMLGYTAGEVVNQVKPSIFHDSQELQQRAVELSLQLGREIASGTEFFMTVTQDGKTYENEWTYIRRDGSRFPVFLSVKTLRDTEGNNIGFLGIAKDITQQKQIEAALRDSQRRYETLTEAAPVAIFRLDTTGQCIYVNDYWSKLTDRPTPAALGMGWLAGLHPEDRHYLWMKWSQGFEQIRYEGRYLHTDESITWFYLQILPETNPFGSIISYIGTFTDITERKQAEEALRESERRYAHLTEAAPVGIFRLDASGQCIYVNDRWSEMTGRPIQAALGLGWAIAIHPEDRDRLKQEWELKFDQEIVDPREFYESEGRHLRPDGSINWFYVQVIPEIDTNGNISGYIGTLTDISDRQQAEEALRDSEHRYATLAKASPVAIFRLDAVGNCVYINDRWSEMTGRSTSAGLGMGWIEAIHPEDSERILREWFEVELAPNELFDNEGRHLLPDGSIKWFHCYVLPETNASGKVIGYIGTLTDITSRKQTEEQLHQLSERLTLALQSGRFGIWEYDFAQAKQIWDDQMYELYGLSKGEFTGTYDAWLNCIHPEDQDYMLASIQQVLEGQQEYNVEFRIVQPSGKVRFLKGYGILKRNQDGEPVRVIGVNFDITAHKQAEQELIRNRDLREAIFNESADAIFLVDSSTLITLDCNRRAVELFESKDKTQLINISGQALQRHPFTAKETDEIVAEMQSQGVWSREIEYVTLQGKIFWGNIAAKPITVAGRTMNIVRITDISDRKQAQEALAKYAHAVEDLYNNAPCGYHSLDNEGRLIKVNETELQWLGYEREEMIGQPLVNFFTPASRLAFTHNYPFFKQRGWAKDLEYEMICKDGKVLPVLINATAVKDANGRYLYNRATLFDISDRKQAEEELQQTNKQLVNTNIELARATRLKDEFLANMSHELRTPLNAILGMSEGLQESVFGSLNERQVKAIATIERSGRHLLELINDILDLSKIESGKLELQLSDVSVRSLCDASLTFVKQMALKKNIRLNTHIDSNIAIIQVDERRLRQVLINLLSNAVKFTPEGGSVTIEVRREEIEEVTSPPNTANLCFHVTDTGIGIAPEEIGKLFQPFVQLDSSLNRHYSGTGLGLALVQRIVKLHGGTVSVTSELGKGSCFTVRVPYLTCEYVITTPITTLLPRNVLPAENAQVLIIEDSVAAADQITRYFHEMGMQPITYSQGGGAVEEVLRVQPALVILDLQLPNLSGWDVLHQLKTNPQSQNIPVIIFSVVDERTKGLAQGAFEYLVKPITRAQLQETIGKLQNLAYCQEQNQTLASEAAFANPMILLVEDNQANIDTISGYLESRGYHLIFANNGQQAIDIVKVQHPDLIIMDIQMPGMDGLEAMRRIRDDRQFENMPMIALTALAMPGDRETSLAAGANEYLTKPVKLKQLVATIQKLLGR
ncbi:two-component hybrid sensor and regulator [Anabaenopsis circularis NIES-21]|uniref:Circadian input-output histidine kinase CikA n=1 Tax=Anabaenopsis circularis NIES-21 TaxID=1085406 RepID=A0A1Z4GB50_9CYAN|nr:two-component hybrid sensor and regulator [Anabaenopsis circularis NIES-21]